MLLYPDEDSIEIESFTENKQTAVWGQQRPPAILAENRTIEVYLGDSLIARSSSVVRVIGPPGSPATYYVPRSDVQSRYLKPVGQGSDCKWRGKPSYFTIDTGAATVPSCAACHYPNPSEDCAILADHVCFHPGCVKCYIDGERVWCGQNDEQGSWNTSETV